MQFRRNYNVELLARTMGLSYDLTPDVVKSWDRWLWRGKRILVPIHVKALVVESAENGPWADMSVAVIDDPDAGDNEQTIRRPKPFQDKEGNRARGIYVHWALPDALTQGASTGGDEEPTPTLMDVSDVPQDDPIADEEIEFPTIPDRWLIVRISSGRTQTSKRRIDGWVIESEEIEGEQVVTPWYQWEEDRSDDKPDRWLTALGMGDPAFMAYYDNAENMLGFYDNMSGISSGPITYMVSGWYSDKADDPLFEPSNDEAFFDLLDKMRWSVSKICVTDHANKATKEAAEHWKLDYLIVSNSIYATQQLLDDSYINLLQSKFSVQDSPSMTTMAMMMEALPETTVDFKTADNFGYEPVLASLAPIANAGFSTESLLFKQYYPRQMLCHGTVYDVKWNGKGGQYALDSAGIPPVGSVKLAFGNTYLEALAAALAKRSNKPDIERLYSALHFGLLPVLNEADGIAKLESRLHAEDFASKSGGHVIETIQQGEQVPPMIDKKRYISNNRRTSDGKLQTQSSFSEKRIFHYDAGMLDLKSERDEHIKDALITDLNYNTRGAMPIRRALPRFWEAKDPSILLLEPHRSPAHGQDGRFTDDNTLPCRVTDEPVTTLRLYGYENSYVQAKDIATIKVASGQLPLEISQILAETLLLDPNSAPIAVQNMQPSIVFAGQARNPIDDYAKTVTSHYLTHAYQDVDDSGIAAMLPLENTPPIPIAMQPWQPPWTPLHLEWEVEWYESPFSQETWLLKEHDFEYQAETPSVEQEPDHIYVGRTLLTPAPVNIVADRITKIAEDEAQGAIPTKISAALGQALSAINNLDVLATSLSGLQEAMTGIFDSFDFDVVTGVDPDDEPDIEIFPIRSGHLRLRRARIVDAYGQIYDFDTETLQNPIRSEDVEVDDDLSALQLNPRISQPARAMFRLLRANDDTLEASKLNSPVSGWILPDHLDQALEIYDGTGQNMGQVQTNRDLLNVEWQGVPGFPTPLGAPPQINNPHLSAFVESLLSLSNRDLAAKNNPDKQAPKESALSALLRMIDSTLWTVDPIGRRGDEHLSVLVGRPLALVRAGLELSLEDDAITEELLRTPFPFRLGAVNRLDDGLMGYFINDDYDRFYPVHESIALGARASSPHQGYLDAASNVPDYYHEFKTGNPPVDAVNHPYVDTSPVIYLRPNQKVFLTLLIDPRGGVHLTSGILPRKKIELMREHVATALDNIILTFRIGPVLTDPEQVSMPLPEDIKGGWSWVRRTEATVWADVDVVNTSDQARLPNEPSEITEGWLKLTGGFAEDQDNPSL